VGEKSQTDTPQRSARNLKGLAIGFGAGIGAAMAEMSFLVCVGLAHDVTVGFAISFSLSNKKSKNS